jgi:hypothetical protein
VHTAIGVSQYLMPRRVKPTLTITSSVVPYKTLVHHFSGHKIGNFIQAFTFT